MDDHFTIDLAQSASTDSENSDVRKLHANLIADAHQQGFPTRGSLEKYIRERQSEIEAAVNCGFDIDEKTRARADWANDEMRRILPLRLILHTASDLAELIEVLQLQKERAMQSLDMEKARNIQSEIDEHQDQIDKEERFLLTKPRELIDMLQVQKERAIRSLDMEKARTIQSEIDELDKEERFLLNKRMGETKCVECSEMFVAEMEMVGILKKKKMRCDKCSDIAINKLLMMKGMIEVDTDRVSEDKDNNSAESSNPVEERPTSIADSFVNLFGQSWW